MRLLARLRLLAVVLLCLLVIPVQGVLAHAQLLSTEPADNAIVQSAPEQLTLVFNEPVTPLAIKLIQPDGTTRDVTDVAVGGASTSIQMPTDLGNGTHVLSWRVVSIDGHPVAGSLVFSIGAASDAAVAEVSDDRAVTVLLWAGKALMFIAMFVGVGGATAGTAMPLPEGARRTCLALCAVGMPIAAGTLGLQGLDALGMPLAALAGIEAWRTGLSTSYGLTAIAVIIAFALALLAIAIPRAKVFFGILAAAVASLSLALSGHASAASPQWLTRPAVFLHIGGVIFWIGALLPLGLLLREQSAGADKALACFSRYILFAVAPLVVSGVTLAIIQLGLPGPQWLTGYGFILAAKLALLSVLFALALWNRRWLTAPALAGDAMARDRLRRSILWEVALVLLIIGLVAGWRFTPPPRALSQVPVAIAAEPIMAHLIDGDVMAMVTVAPGKAGPVAMDIMISDLEHVPRAVQDVTLIVSNGALGIEPIHRTAVDLGGVWRVEDLTLPVAGTWQVEIEVRVSTFERARPAGEILLP
jgi:copper transport protein